MNTQELIDKTEVPEWDKETFKKVFYPKKEEETPQISFFNPDLERIREKGIQQNAEVRQRIKQKIPTAEQILEELNEK